MIQDASLTSSLRIAFVSGNLFLGGGTTFLCNLGGELVRRQIPVHILSLTQDNPLARDFERAQLPVSCINNRHLIFEDRLSIVLAKLSAFKPSVVMATLDAISFEALRYLPAGVFRVGVMQADYPDTYECLKHYAAHMDMFAAVSETVKRNAEMLPEFSRVPVVYLPYGVPLPSSAREREPRIRREPVVGSECAGPETGAPVDQSAAPPLRILYLGRLIADQKRVRCFPAILERLKASGIPFHWTIAGDGPEREYLERTMAGTETQTLSFPGKMPYADVPRLLSAHDILLLASDHEGLPLSLLEAMGYGLVPVISDLTSGIPEVVDESNGILVSVDNVAGYADAIIHLHNHREELAAKSAAAHKRVMTEFSVEAMTNRWLAVFPKTFSQVEWPRRWRIRSMLVGQKRFYFTPPMRVLRRLAMRLRV